MRSYEYVRVVVQCICHSVWAFKPMHLQLITHFSSLYLLAPDRDHIFSFYLHFDDLIAAVFWYSYVLCIKSFLKTWDGWILARCVFAGYDEKNSITGLICLLKSLSPHLPDLKNEKRGKQKHYAGSEILPDVKCSLSFQ